MSFSFLSSLINILRALHISQTWTWHIFIKRIIFYKPYFRRPTPFIRSNFFGGRVGNFQRRYLTKLE